MKSLSEMERETKGRLTSNGTAARVINIINININIINIRRKGSKERDKEIERTPSVALSAAVINTLFKYKN